MRGEKRLYKRGIGMLRRGQGEKWGGALIREDRGTVIQRGNEGKKKINTKDVLKDIGKHFIRLLKYACVSICLYVCGLNRVLPHGVTMFPLKATDTIKK